MSEVDSAAPDPGETRKRRRSHGQPTLRHIAEASGVTRITVSRFFREPERVAPETAARIRAAIEATGYLPNRQAGSLASGESRIVAAIVPNIGHSIFAETLQGLSETLSAHNRELLLTSSGYSLAREQEQIEELLAWRPAALVLTGRHHSPIAQRLIARAAQQGTPVVEMWDLSPDDAPASQTKVAQIGFDHHHAGRAMARFLLDCGYQTLNYVDSSVQEDYRAHERAEGFMAQAQALGAPVHLFQAPAGDPILAGGRMAQAIFRAAQQRVGIAFANDWLAAGFLQAGIRAGHQSAVPERFGVLGFGDFPVGLLTEPTLSTLHPPREEIGRMVAHSILESLQRNTAPKGRELHCAVIARGSTRPPRD